MEKEGEQPKKQQREDEEIEEKVGKVIELIKDLEFEDKFRVLMELGLPEDLVEQVLRWEDEGGK